MAAVYAALLRGRIQSHTMSTSLKMPELAGLRKSPSFDRRPPPHAFPKARARVDQRAFAGRRLPLDWTSSARMIAAIRPGKRASIPSNERHFAFHAPTLAANQTGVPENL